MEREIREGMTVRSSDGEKLGKVIRCGDDEFVIEKGFFFPKDYVARYDQASVSGGEVLLAIPASSLRAAGDERDLRSRESSASGLGTEMGTYAMDASGRPTEGEGRGTGSGSRLAHGATEDVRVPVAEEELVAEKRERQAGEVRVRKDVATEHKQIDVPVTREEVHVDRVPTSARDAVAEGKLFQKDTVSVPVHEEELEIKKRPVVKEEVRLRKDRIVEQRAADEDIKKERVDVDETGTGTKRSITDPDDEFSGS